LRLVLFDVDGTLVDAGGAGRWALSRAFEKLYGVEGMEARAAGVPFAGPTDQWIIAEMASRAGLGPGFFDKAGDEFEETYLALLRERLAGGGRAHSLPGVTQLLGSLRGRGALLGLVTGNIRRGARVKLESAGLSGWFEGGAFAEDAVERKEIARIARERFESIRGVKIVASQVLMVGDGRQDVSAARANGYRSLAVETGWTAREDLQEEGPDLLLADLSGTEELVAWICGAG
jgi:phosphoglycolate phosphatase-like HAD superfamily hydrolase